MSAYPGDHQHHPAVPPPQQELPGMPPAAPQPWADVAPVSTPYVVVQQAEGGHYTAVPAPQFTPPGPGDTTMRAQVQPGGAAVLDPAAAAPQPYLPAVTPRRDPQRTALAAIITFIVAMIGLWAVLAYVHSMSVVLSSVSSSTRKVAMQLGAANEGLAALDTKTANVRGMNENSAKLAGLMQGINGDMGGMLAGVDEISAGMATMNSSLSTLDADMQAVGASNAKVAGTLGGINTGLKSQADQVKTMRRDVVATSKSLKSIPPMLVATNSRLNFVNRVVCIMGSGGLSNQIVFTVRWLGLTTGSAQIKATMVPPGGWTC